MLHCCATVFHLLHCWLAKDKGFRLPTTGAATRQSSEAVLHSQPHILALLASSGLS